MTTDQILHPEQQAILEELDLVLGSDWRQDYTHLRWIPGPQGRPLLQADGIVLFGFMADGKFAARQRIGLNEVRMVIGSADHIWHKTETVSPEEREDWDRSLADYGIHIRQQAA
jgi:hypothetical protein